MRRITNGKMIEMAINIIGGVNETAKKMNCSSHTVLRFKRSGNLTIERLLILEKLCDYRVQRHEMAPKLFEHYTHVSHLND